MFVNKNTKPQIRQSKPETRRYSVMPARSIQDDDLHYTTLRLLGAICLHTNKYGICFPSRVTLGRHISRTPKTISIHIQKLIKLGYIRKLNKRPYRIPGANIKSKYATNRYQVLYDGPQTILPTKEQFYAPRPKIAEEYPEENLQNVIDNSKGLKGGKINELQKKSIAQAFCSGIERGCGQPRIPDNYLKEAEIVAAAGITAEQVLEYTATLTITRLQENKPMPLTLIEVCKATGLM